MKKNTQVYLVLLLSILLVGCSTGYRTYEKGDYFRACYESIQRLRSNPKNKKSQAALTQAYPMALKTAQREIDNAMLGNAPEKYDIVVSKYDQINQLANTIYNCPKAYELIPQPTEYVAELSKAKQLAAETAYDTGIKFLGYNTLEQARIAYQYLVKANNYMYGYKDVLNKIEDARYNGTMRVIVQKPYTSTRYQYSADFFYNNLLAEMNESTKNRLVHFYTPDEATAENMRDPHQYIVLNFEDFTIGNVHETSNTTDVKRDSVIVGTVTVEGKKYNSYNTVKAKLTTNRREITSAGVLSLRIVDARTSRDLQLKNFGGQYVWVSDWASFQGDDRALTNDQKRMCERKPKDPPVTQDFFIEFTKPIYSQVVTFVRNAYSKY